MEEVTYHSVVHNSVYSTTTITVSNPLLLPQSFDSGRPGCPCNKQNRVGICKLPEFHRGKHDFRTKSIGG